MDKNLATSDVTVPVPSLTEAEWNAIMTGSNITDHAYERYSKRDASCAECGNIKSAHVR